MRLKSSTLRSTESGSALMAVVAVTAITFLIAVTVTGATVSALSTTVSTRASVQANAAALGGVDATLAALKSPAGCTNGGAYSSMTVPAYRSQISHSVDGSTWIAECPNTTARQVKIASTGLLSGPSSGTKSIVESVYAYTPTGAVGGGGVGSSVYSFGGSNNLNSLTTLSGGSEVASVVMKTMPGTLNCQNSTINGDVTLESGSFQGSGGCVIKGNLTVGGTVELNSGATVLGNVTASGSGLYSVRIEGSTTRVGGNVVAGGPVRIAGIVDQNVTAGPGLGTSVLASGGRVGGAMTLSGGISADGASTCPSPLNTASNASQACAVKKALRITDEPVFGRAGIPAPVPTTTPNWVNYTYKLSDWTSQGFTPVTWSNDQCNVGSWNVAQLANLAALTTKTVVDATACAELVLQPDTPLKWKADVAFIAKKFSLGPANHDSFTTDQRKMWFIVPGSGTTTTPVCPAGDCTVNIYGTIAMSSRIAAFVYTPGTIENSRNDWRGQMYGRQVNFGQSISITYVPIGLPGADLSSGSTPVGGGGSIGALISSRELADRG